MKYTMYHRDLPTITFNMNERGYVDKIFSVENESHIHPFLLIDGKVDPKDNYYSLYDGILRWMQGRNIPASRKNLASALSTLGVKSADELASNSFYLSLSDQYWVAPSEMNLKWEKINFFTNDFSEDVGRALFGEPPQNKKINLRSPDPSTTGQLVKKWVIEGGERMLVKGGSGTEQLEPFNEVLATEICARLGIKAINYELYIEDRRHFCKCRNFASENTEYITAADVCEDLTDWNSGFVSYTAFKNRCELLGIALDEKELGKMFLLDYLIANEDRHLNNFGFLRDSQTLEWKGLCPVYDSGTSMFHNFADFELEGTVGLNENSIHCKPFSDNYIKQLHLFPFIDVIRELPLERLDGIGSFYRNLLSKNQRNISAEKIDRLSDIIQKRTEVLKAIRKVRKITDLPIVMEFRHNLSGVSETADFKSFVQEKYQNTVGNDGIKKELLSFYLKGPDFKNEKDFEREIKNFASPQKTSRSDYYDRSL